MIKIILISLSLLVIGSSCINNKFVYQSNTIYRLQTTPPPAPAPGPAAPAPAMPAPAGPIPALTYQFVTSTPNAPFMATISDKGDYLIITPGGGAAFTDAAIPTTAPTGVKFDNLNRMYFPETQLVVGGPYRFRYFDTKPVLQALSIPLKIRPRLTSEALQDSFPSQAETSFNVGVSFGWKFTHNVYNARKNIFGQNTNRFSLAPGVFLGTGAVDLKKANTRGPAIDFERKAALITTGGFFMLGFNNINIGYAIGADFATGMKSEQWLYQGKIWHGIIFAIDLLK